MLACHARDRGSIPRQSDTIFISPIIYNTATLLRKEYLKIPPNPPNPLIN